MHTRESAPVLHLTASTYWPSACWVKSKVCSAGMQDRDQLQQRVRGAKGFVLNKLLGPLGGQGVPKARRPGRRVVEQTRSITKIAAAGTETALLVGADLGARQTRAGLSIRVSRYSQRKDAEYARQLERAYR